jgi:putative pyruvate formate lyase activating enzyme
MRCVYCQNWQISQPASSQEQCSGMEFERLASILLELQAAGCHNIGFVSPTHFVPQIVRSVEQAAAAGLRLPLIYNTNAYDDVGVLRLLEGIFDIYLPDLRYAEDAVALEYSRVPGYVGHSRAALAEMYRQVGEDLITDERGLVQHGLIIRLLILPNGLGGLRETLEWIRETLSPRVTLSVMSQYYPSGRVTEERFPLLARRISVREYEKVVGWMDSLGFENGWIQPLEAQAAEYYRPDFADPSQPFADARDFAAD